MVIINGRIYTMEQDVIACGYVRICDKVIEEVGEMDSFLPKKEDGRVLDVDGAWVLPGLIEAHCHIGITEEKWGVIADDILTAIRIAKEFDVNITIDHGTESHLIADEIKASGFPVISGPQLSARSKLEVQNMDFKSNKTLYDKGILFAITTDHPVTLIQYLPICAGMAVKKGISLEEGLRAITIHPAKICGVDDRIGSLRPGKDADIAIFSGNPMEIFTETLYTIIDGEMIYEMKDKDVN